MDTPFTPGPWNYRQGMIWTSDSLMVASVMKSNLPEKLHNGHLIEAAPEMYEALCMFANGTNGIEGWYKATSLAQKALAKVRGESVEDK